MRSSIVIRLSAVGARWVANSSAATRLPRRASLHNVGARVAIMSFQDWRFYGIIGGCLLAAGILVALMIGGEVAGPLVAETPSHQSQHE